MKIKTVTDLGAAIKDARKRQGMDQQALAKRVGVSRQWIIDIEKGKPRASVDLVLRTLDALGMPLDIKSGKAPGRIVTTNYDDVLGGVDINTIITKTTRRDKK
jgi:HTH-type transcriptional regulator / antitoxin HipB